MTAYLIKVILCSAVFWAVHRFVLANQKIPVFNRFYLLFALVFSGIAPKISIELPAMNDVEPYVVSSSLPSALMPRFEPSPAAEATFLTDSQTPLPIEVLFWGIYFIITAFFLVRFIKNIVAIVLKIRQNQIIKTDELNIVLIPQKTMPHSFLNYVFMNIADYENRNVEREIWCHERVHVVQKHSFDVLFVEILAVFCWFNPMLFLYRKAIVLNHEFLADQGVIRTFQNPISYQYLLLNKISEASGLQLSSQFNYLITKKRLIMLNKVTTPARAWATQITVFVFFVAITFAFSDLSQAQSPTERKPVATTPATEKGVSPALLEEYQTIALRNVEIKKTKNGGKSYRFKELNDSDQNRLETIFKAMSKAQQAQQKYWMFPPAKPLPKIMPTEKAFESYKNAKMYGVWIDGRKVKNSVLDNHKASDFSQVFISKLYKNARTGVTYNFQLDLETNEYYEKEKAKTLANKKWSLFLNDFFKPYDISLNPYGIRLEQD